MAFGVDTEVGFNLKRFRDIQLSQQGLLDQIVDPNTGETLQVDFNEDDPLVNILNSFIDAMAVAWENVELSYQQFDPTLSTGPSLSGLVQLNGLSRKGGTPSTIPIQYFGSAGTIVPAGQQITDIVGEIVWITDSQVTLDGGGNAVGSASSQSNGIFIVSTEDVNRILTPVSGWNAVQNSSESTLGTTDELDGPLRIRRRNGTLTPAQSIIECIQSTVLNLDGVVYSRAFQNRSLIVDSNGIPGKSVAMVVSGGTDQDVAEQIFVRLGTGTETFGTTTVNFTDPFGETTPINFIRPTERIISVEVSLTVTDSNLFGDDSPDEIKDAIVSYAEQGAVGIGVDPEAVGFDPFGFPPGEPVLISRLYTPVNSIAGHNVSSIKVSFEPAIVGDVDLVIDFDEVSKFSTANITVIVS